MAKKDDGSYTSTMNKAVRYCQNLRKTPYKERLARDIERYKIMMPQSLWLIHRVTFDDVQATISLETSIKSLDPYIAGFRKDLVARYKQEWEDHLSMIEESDE